VFTHRARVDRSELSGTRSAVFETNGDMNELKAGTLVAVTSGVDETRVRRIARVLYETGDIVTVETDDVIEHEAAVEFDFPTPNPAILDVHRSCLRLIMCDSRTGGGGRYHCRLPAEHTEPHRNHLTTWPIDVRNASY
jgi:hypothetical protein